MDDVERNNNKVIVNIIIALIIILLCLVIVFFIRTRGLSENNKDNNQVVEDTNEDLSDTSNDEIDTGEAEPILKKAELITDNEINNLIESVRRISNYDPDFLGTPLSKMDGSNLLTIAIDSEISDSEDYLIEMNQKLKDDIISKNTYFDDTGLLYRYLNYDSNKVFDKVKELFNIDKKDLNFNYDKQQCLNYSYIENVDVMFLKENCGGIALFYSEEVESFTIEEDAAIVITKIESLVSNYTGEDIKDEEADGKKLKYTFKKNSSGKYYVSEIEKNS